MGVPNWKNRTLFRGDNLKFLRAMNSESVDLIATDPPFKKGRDFHATPDSLLNGAGFQDRWSWERDVHKSWLDQIQDDWPAVWEVIDAANAVHMQPTKKNLKMPREKVGSDMGAFLCFIAVRLIAMRRVLKPTGSICLHCDPTASHYLKATMDAVFGKRNFRNEIIWCYTDPAGRKNTNYYKWTHDSILWYSKSNNYCAGEKMYMTPLSQSTLKRYEKYFDENGQLTYADLKRTNPGVFAKLKAVPDDLHEIWLDKEKGTTAGDWWNDITPIRRKGAGQSAKEPYFYPTQKPLTLHGRIITTASKEGDIVLDPFAGCATTCVVAEKFGRQWVGMDIWEKAHQVVVQRLEQEALLGEFKLGDIPLIDEPPARTDDGETASPFLRVKKRIKEPDGPRWTRAQIYEYLLDQNGVKCEGCYRTFNDRR